ncbi:MAG: helix-turn-helix transcriptional regulator [Clostridia bacterium]|nr:helix-turn-helix transcriptional regulator [Clostridia bacterium]
MKIYNFDGKKNICGKKVREIRKKSDITQDELAARLQVEGVNIERDSISRLEKGTRFVADYELIVLAKVLGVKVEELVSND